MTEKDLMSFMGVKCENLCLAFDYSSMFLFFASAQHECCVLKWQHWCVLSSGSGGGRPEEGRHRHVGDQRGLQRGGAGQHQDVGHRPLKGQREWRRRVPGTPHRVSVRVTLDETLTRLEPHGCFSERKTCGGTHV